MKKLRGALYLMLLCVIMTAISYTSEFHLEPLQVVDCHGLMMEFDYNELKDYADVIAKIQVLDDLREDNSMVDVSSEGYITRFCGVRQVKVIEIWKNTLNRDIKDTLAVQELCAICRDGENKIQLIVNEREPLERGEEYILFLSGRYSMSGELSIVSGENGMVELADVNCDSEYLDIKMKSIIEYESDMNSVEKGELLRDSFVKEGRKIVAKRLKETFQVRYNRKGNQKSNRVKLERASIN